MRTSASVLASLNAAAHSRKCAFASVCVCMRETVPRGKGNEDRWGSFKQPGFTSGEASKSSIAPLSEGKAEQLECFPVF